MTKIMLFTILAPIAASILMLTPACRRKGAAEALAITATFAVFIAAVFTFGKNINYCLNWINFGGLLNIDLSFRLYNFSSFIMTAASFFGFITALYSSVFMRGHKSAFSFYSFLCLTIGFVNGAILSDNLIILLFFWEGLLVTLFGMIYIGGKDSFKTATKAFIIVGVCDLIMMIGIAAAGREAGTFTISRMNIQATGLGTLAFVCLMIGAIAKGGSMPFHAWIPDAAKDAPLPFMSLLPGAIEKLISIYFLTRITMDIFQIAPGSWMSYAMMTIGAVTIVFAVMMALVQKEYKRLLSYHAISQLGYMILGVGTALPIGIVGGLFHMINNALYKSCLFLTGGAVEKEAGTTDLTKLGGIRHRMPVTFACFLITAAAISGVPPLNGFFSKELVYDAALERGMIFYIAAAAGSFFTAASFLKLGHAVFGGKLGERNRGVSEAPPMMLIPMVAVAIICVIFGIFNFLPIRYLIAPAVNTEGSGTLHLSGFPQNTMLVAITIIVLIGALLNHIYGVKKTGKAIGAVDHIHHAPVLSYIYDNAEKGRLDPYNFGMFAAGLAAGILSWIDRALDWLYNILIPRAAEAVTKALRRLHNGSYRTYIGWAFAAAAIIIYIMIKCPQY